METSIHNINPKRNTDSTNVKNYRPISLLNLYYKVFAKILDDRIKIFLINFIKEEQTGFLLQRHLKDNIRTALDVIKYYEKHTEKAIELVFLDEEKTFHNLNWKFMLLFLGKNENGKEIFKCNENNIWGTRSKLDNKLG